MTLAISAKAMAIKAGGIAVFAFLS